MSHGQKTTADEAELIRVIADAIRIVSTVTASGSIAQTYAMMCAVDELHMDRPTAVELLEIMAATLSDIVVPATDSHAQHQARVVANLCRVLGRELAASTADGTELPASLLDVDDAAADSAYPDVLELVRSKLAINKPGYDTHGAAEERGIVA